MVEVDRPRYWRLATFTVLGVTAVTLAGALFMAFRVLHLVDQAVLDEHAKQLIAASSLMAGVLLIFALLCLGLLLIRYASFRTLRRFKRTSTPFVNAWELAGKRFKLSDNDDIEPPDEEKKE